MSDKPIPERRLKYLQPAQYQSWLRKVDDPDWVEHRNRGSKDLAMTSAIRELRDALEQLKVTEAALMEIRDTIEIPSVLQQIATDALRKVGL